VTFISTVGFFGAQLVNDVLTDTIVVAIGRYKTQFDAAYCRRSKMSDDKFFTDLTATTSLGQAASTVLARRLQSVRHYLSKAVEKPGKNPEDVHDLRVATRRATAALGVFGPLLDADLYRKARNVLRQTRRCAGSIRDLDVFLARLDTVQPNAPCAPGIYAIAGYCIARRHMCQQALVSLREDLSSTLEKVHKRLSRAHSYASARQTLGAWAQKQVPLFVSEVQQAAAGDLRRPEQLHALRVAGKHLRYAMEVFAGCYPPVWIAQLYARVGTMQEILGALNDTQMALRFVQEFTQASQHYARSFAKKCRPGCLYLRRLFAAQAKEQTKTFRQFWKTWQKENVLERIRRTVAVVA